ncbi:MAG: hypothetical protein QME81_11360 [bacterium]|nr:hypothetical protein [bacterium]
MRILPIPGLVHRFGYWSNFVVVELARHYGRASSATTKKFVSGRNDEQGPIPQSAFRNPQSISP